MRYRLKVYRNESRQRGFSLVGLVLTLCIIGLIYLGATSLRSGVQDSQATIQEVQVASQKTSCELNRRTLERTILTWQVTHPGAPVNVQKMLRDHGIQGCPEGGRLQLKGDRVECSAH